VDELGKCTGSYLALKLGVSARESLLRAFPPSHPLVTADHVTVKYAPQKLPPGLVTEYGRSALISVLAVFDDGCVQAALVAWQDDDFDGEYAANQAWTLQADEGEVGTDRSVSCTAVRCAIANYLESSGVGQLSRNRAAHITLSICHENRPVDSNVLLEHAMGGTNLLERLVRGERPSTDELLAISMSTPPQYTKESPLVADSAASSPKQSMYPEVCCDPALQRKITVSVPSSPLLLRVSLGTPHASVAQIIKCDEEYAATNHARVRGCLMAVQRADKARMQLCERYEPSIMRVLYKAHGDLRYLEDLMEEVNKLDAMRNDLMKIMPIYRAVRGIFLRSLLRCTLGSLFSPPYLVMEQPWLLFFQNCAAILDTPRAPYLIKK